jgi:hypothetical protein
VCSSDLYYRKLDETKIFNHTAYNFPRLLDVCEKLARQGLVRVGGRIEKDGNSAEVFVIPVKAPTPSKFEDLKNPGPTADSLYSDEEMRKVRSPGLQWASKFLNGWTVSHCNLDQSAMLWESQGRQNVFILNGLIKGQKSYVLANTLPAGKASTLEFAAACDPRTEGWKVTVRTDGKAIGRETVNQATMKNGWTRIRTLLLADGNKPSTVEIVMEPVTAPTERKGPPALSITVPAFVDR